METLLLQILAASYATLGLMVVIVTFNFALWSVIIQERRPNIPQLFDLTTKAVKRGVYALDVKLQKRRKKPKDKDLQPLPVPFDEVGFRTFCRELLKAVNNAASIEDVKLTEAEWTKNRTREQFVAYRTRLEERGIVCIVDGRGTRGWRTDQNGSYAWARGRLEKLVK